MTRKQLVEQGLKRLSETNSTEKESAVVSFTKALLESNDHSYEDFEILLFRGIANYINGLENDANQDFLVFFTSIITTSHREDRRGYQWGVYDVSLDYYFKKVKENNTLKINKQGLAFIKLISIFFTKSPVKYFDNTQSYLEEETTKLNNTEIKLNLDGNKCQDKLTCLTKVKEQIKKIIDRVKVKK